MTHQPSLNEYCRPSTIHPPWRLRVLELRGLMPKIFQVVSTVN
jgi:hypothetical protein